MATPRRTKKSAPKKPTERVAEVSPPPAPPAKKATRSAESAAKAAIPSGARKEYTALLHEIEVAEYDELRGWDRKWEAIARVFEKKYFVLDDDAPTAPSWVKKHTSDDYRSALRNARVATVASPEEEKRFTTTKIDIAIGIELEKQAKAASKAKVAFDPKKAAEKIALSKLRYSVVRDGKKRELDLEAITPNELRAIATGKPVGEKRPKEPMSKEGKRVERALRANKRLNGVTVSEGDNELAFGKVRFDQVSELGKALSGVVFDE